MLIDTQRTQIKPFALTDAGFILQLLNEPTFIQNIGDKGVRNHADARDYLRTGPMASYQQHSFGLWRVDHKQSHEPIGMCGVLKRAFLESPDLGYALLPQHCGQGLAFEACIAVLAYARESLNLDRILAIVSDDNTRSIHLLDKLGFVFEKNMVMPGAGDPVLLYAVSLS
ncbi:MAG: GNAT family N-acetyltransferase [Gammaproteobacteria bacterium]|nr:GNAT family N-acetyltransferase [Gammaproteobacteria bacterium]